MAGGAVAIDQSRSQDRAQGQCSGRCRSSRLLVAAIRAGTVMSFRRRLAQRAVRWLAATAVARVMLNAITAQQTQAALAAYFPDGRCAKALSFNSAMTCSMMAWSRCR